MRGAAVPVIAIVGVALSAIVGLFVAAFLNTYLSDYWVRGIVSSAIGVAVAVQLARSVLARHARGLTGGRGRSGQD